MSPNAEPAPTIDLTTCDREPIHIPGSIQPHGLLIALSEPDLSMIQVSANAPVFTGLMPAELLGRPLGSLLDAPSMQRLDAALASARPQDDNPLRVTIAEQAFDGLVHRYKGVVILELEPRELDRDEAPSVVYFRAALARMTAAPSMQSLCNTVARDVRMLTGYDRVMIYRFDEDHHGEVIAEACRDDLEPFLGLHYPASDIPSRRVRSTSSTTCGSSRTAPTSPCPSCRRSARIPAVRSISRSPCCARSHPFTSSTCTTSAGAPR